MVAVLAFVLAGCDKYDDSELRNKVNGYESRIAALESLASYQTLLQNLQAGKTVTSYSKSENEITLTFSDGSSVTFNQKGEPGTPGQGTPGKDGKTPKFKIEGDKWYVSYDDGATWETEPIGDAVEHSLFQNVTADEATSTLFITLADGTTIPIFYGTLPAAEPFGFEIANGRRCFSILESLETIYSKTITLPYTLTGNITSPDDVEIETRVTSYKGIASGYEMVTVTKTDAKNGTISARMMQDYEGTGWDGGEFYQDYPELVLEVTAHFPDGTSSYKKLYIIGYGIYMETDEDTWDLAYVEWDSTLKMNVIRLPKEAGEFKIIMRYGTQSYTDRYFYDYYDGAPFAAYQFEKVFYEVRLYPEGNGIFLGVNVNSEPTVKTHTHGWDATYVVNITFTKNTLNRDRYNDLQFWQRESASSSGGTTRIRVIQAH